MPISSIETGRVWPPAQQQFLIQSVHAALVEAFCIPEHDRLVRYIEHRPDHFVVPPGSSDAYILVSIAAFPGRTIEAKRALYQSIVRRFGEIGIPAADIRIVVQEIARENWGIRGGVPASDVELGFKVNV